MRRARRGYTLVHATAAALLRITPLAPNRLWIFGPGFLTHAFRLRVWRADRGLGRNLAPGRESERVAEDTPETWCICLSIFSGSIEGIDSDRTTCSARARRSTSR